MPTLDQHPGSNLVKMLNIGRSKTGKTGSLAGLAIAGYNLWILDYDNGLETLGKVLRDPKVDPEVFKRIHYETLRDDISTLNGTPRIKPPPKAFKAAGATLEKWHAEKFTPQDVIVLDTLMSFSEAAFRQAVFLAGRLNQRAQLQDYGWMGESVILFIEMLTSPEINCHVVVNTHIKYIGGDEETQENAVGLPDAKGKEVAKNASRFFNTVVLTRSFGTGPGTRRVISTQPQGVIEVATSNPKGVDATYPVDNVGMAKLFRDILGHGPPASKGAAAASNGKGADDVPVAPTGEGVEPEPTPTATAKGELSDVNAK
jgi:hypothetical protein